MFQWVIAHPNVLAAGSTVLLALFAAVQIGLEIYRNRQVAIGALIELGGPAWLARRTLEQALFSAQTNDDVFSWARSAGHGEGLDRVEQQMLSVLRLGAKAKGKAARSAEEAFENFLAYADRLNQVAAIPWTRAEGGVSQPTDVERDRADELANEAVRHLRVVVERLSDLAPRQPHESALPLPGDVRFLKEPATESTAVTAGRRDGRLSGKGPRLQ